MNTSVRTSIMLTATLAFSLFAGSGCRTSSQDVPMPPKQTPPPKAPSTPASKDAARIPADFEEVAAFLKLEGEQWKRFYDRAIEREKLLAEWEKTPQAKKQRELEEAIQIAKKAGEENLAVSFKAQLQPVAEQFWAYRKKLRADVLGVLTLEQQKKLASLALYNMTIQRHLRDTAFDEGQLQQIKTLAVQKANTAVGPDTFKNDPYLTDTFNKTFMDNFVTSIKTGIMTDEQRRMSAPLPKSKTPPPVAPGTGRPTK